MDACWEKGSEISKSVLVLKRKLKEGPNTALKKVIGRPLAEGRERKGAVGTFLNYFTRLTR